MKRTATVPEQRSTPPSVAPATSTGPASARSAEGWDDQLARVDLLPAWVREEQRVRHVRRRLAAALVASVLLVGAGWGVQQMRLADVRGDLDAEELVGQDLTATIDELRPVELYVAGVAARQREVGTALTTDVAFDRVLAALDRALPAGGSLQDVSVTLPTPGTAAAPGAVPAAPLPPENRGVVADCPQSDPFGALAVVGCATVTGTVPDRQALAALLRALDDAELLAEPFVTTSTAEEGGPVTFTGSVGLTAAVFSGRFDALAPEVAVLAQPVDQPVDQPVEETTP